MHLCPPANKPISVCVMGRKVIKTECVVKGENFHSGINILLNHLWHIYNIMLARINITQTSAEVFHIICKILALGFKQHSLVGWGVDCLSLVPVSN